MAPRGLLLFLVLCNTAAYGQQSSLPDAAEPAPARRLPGMQDDGLILLPTQWSLRPAGKHVPLGDFPVHIALHPSEPLAAILHCGYGEHEVIVVDLDREKIVSRSTIPQAFYGLCFDPSGNRLYVSGGEDQVVYEFRCQRGSLTSLRTLRIGGADDKFVIAGLATSPAGDSLYVASAWGDRLSIVPLDDPGRIAHVAFLKDTYPYTVLPSPDGSRLFVSLWGAAGVAVVDAKTREIAATWPADKHPTEMLLSPAGDVLYVACANSNHVVALDPADGAALETIATGLYAKAPVGSTPNSIALSPDGEALAVANADNNNLALIDVSERKRSRSLGYIPVGWYPTSVRFEKDGKRLFVANGKGFAPKSNRHGPRPGAELPATVREYIGGLHRGSLSIVDVPSPARMAAHTKIAFSCSPLQADEKPRAELREEGNPIPASVGEPSPIKHCIYVIKENRTYDQILGDMPEGNGDESLCIFPEKVTPNHHALARQFVLLDNFYVESEVSADGHEWSMAAYATDFVEKAWPLNYRGGRDTIDYVSEGAYPIAESAGGYIWDRCKEAGVSFRSYGEFVDNGKMPDDPGVAAVPGLEGHFDPLFRSYDLDYPDNQRVDRFVTELKKFEEEGGFPQFIVLRLPNDHTYGTTAGKPTPTAMVAENDLALGRLVEAVSKSKFWPETAIFVVEDDAQNGSDHVDAHRTTAFVISPYTKRGFVDSSMYSTASMLRSMELILGLKPMTQFDAAALPMYASFQAKPDTSGYQHRPANVDLTALNDASAWGADLSATLDLSKEDAADDLLFNEIIWRSVRGPESRMPAPVRAAFVFAEGEEEEEEEE